MPSPIQMTSTQARPRSASGWRLLRGLIAVLVVTGVMIGLLLWWEDGPLREIERSLDHQEYEQALRRVGSYLARFPGHSRALNQKGRALAGLRRWSEAVRLFEQVGSDSPASERAWSQALLHQERWSEAWPLLKRLNKR